MLKEGIQNDTQRQIAAEAFVNFLSRPDIAVRNMYYIGYTSSIAADEVFQYFDWCYGAITDPEDEEYYELTDGLYEYDVSYFFGDGHSIYVDMSTLHASDVVDTGETVDGHKVYSGGIVNSGRQAFGQYPTKDVISRSVVMLDFGDDLAAINQMWINVRCLDILDIPVTTVVIVAVIIVAVVAAILIYRFRYEIFYSRPRKNKAN